MSSLASHAVSRRQPPCHERRSHGSAPPRSLRAAPLSAASRWSPFGEYPEQPPLQPERAAQGEAVHSSIARRYGPVPRLRLASAMRLRGPYPPTVVFSIWPAKHFRRMKGLVPVVPIRIRKPSTSASLSSACPVAVGLKPRSFASVNSIAKAHPDPGSPAVVSQVTLQGKNPGQFCTLLDKKWRIDPISNVR